MSYPPGPPDEPDPSREQPGPPQQYAPYAPYGYPQAPATNGKATGSLVTGITTLVLFWCCGLGVLGVAAIVLGVKARHEISTSGGAQSGDGMALAGIITGAVAVVLGLVFLAVVIIAIASGSAEYDVNAHDSVTGQARIETSETNTRGEIRP